MGTTGLGATGFGVAGAFGCGKDSPRDPNNGVTSGGASRIFFAGRRASWPGANLASTSGNGISTKVSSLPASWENVPGPALRRRSPNGIFTRPVGRRVRTFFNGTVISLAGERTALATLGGNLAATTLKEKAIRSSGTAGSAGAGVAAGTDPAGRTGLVSFLEAGGTGGGGGVSSLPKNFLSDPNIYVPINHGWPTVPERRSSVDTNLVCLLFPF